MCLWIVEKTNQPKLVQVIICLMIMSNFFG